MSHSATSKNRLAQESSPYLLLHQDNPVDWYPWGEEALAKAKKEDKPIFLSVGYSTCYWCHVMERESFADPEIAALMNRHFVNIKVDREERPDLDEIYMTATQILTGQGGWPNSVFLTPELKPFYAGTYFPPDDRYGRPGFPAVLQGLAEAWEKRRPEVEEQAEAVAAAMKRFLEERGAPTAEPPGSEAAETALKSLAQRFDPVWGGFGGAPKFPTPSNLFLLLEFADQDRDAARMLSVTLDRMARGGIYDHLGGGFHRYATDLEWKIPHFEKMLYDNGLLLEVYARQYQRTRDPEMERVVRETAAFLRRELTSPEGAFWSAIDAQTEGKEGAYYVWTREELEGVLGKEDAAFLAPIFGFEGPPFFEGDHYVLHLPKPLSEAAAQRRMSREELLAALKPLREKLLDARSRRQRPLTDDKILADWNGMAITGLAVAGEVLGEETFVQQAARAAEFVLHRMCPGEGPLLHVWREGKGRIPAYLADYAYLVRGLLALHSATGEDRWLKGAQDLSREQIHRLRDPQGGYYLAPESPDLLFRTKEVFDGATPAANGVAVLNLLELGERTQDDFWHQEAREALRAFGTLVNQYPEGVRMMTLAVRRFAGTREAPAEAGGVSPAAPGGKAVELLELARQVVKADLILEGAVGEDGWRTFQVTLEIAAGWHVNANPAAEEFLIPTRVKGEGVKLRNLKYPPGEERKFPFADGMLRVYDGQVQISGELRPRSGEEGKVLLTYQACDDSRCLAPVTRELTLP